jgi:hypothetical protein
MWLEKNRSNEKHEAQKPPGTQKALYDFQGVVYEIRFFSSSAHRIGPPQIHVPQGFLPGGTSSDSLRLPPSPRGKAQGVCRTAYIKAFSVLEGVTVKRTN